ncbi:Transferase [Sesbania bispinosa]|nr:Transferase [Sesbania bispinosa]
MEMELISREFIKPSTPTPPHLTIHPLSFIDHIVARNYVPVIYFYPNEASEYDHNNQASKLSMLKNSLSKVLSIYYPFAGRFRDQVSIDCNDQGVSFLVTKIKTNLSKILHNPTETELNPLFPDEVQWRVMDSSASILAIQINCFTCGGIAISVCLSHKVGDGPTLFNFINDWAIMNRNSNEEKTELLFPVLDAGASLFLEKNFPIFPEFVFVKQNTVCRRIVFEGSKIESLKAMVSSHKVENPSRVEVVIALIYKCVVSALRLANNTPLVVAANLRSRMVPPLPEKSIGNWVWSFPVLREKAGETELHELVTKMREGLSEFCDKNVKKFGDFSFVCEFLKNATSVRKRKEDTLNGSEDIAKPSLFYFASWCRLPTYEVDFGWGKPIWVTSVCSPVRNSVILMDTKNGNGIEALVNMEEQDLAILECDEKLLQYASLN